MKRLNKTGVLWVIAGWMFCGTLFAHQMSTAYLTASTDNGGKVAGQWQARLFDLDQALHLDQDQDGDLLWQEVLDRQTQVASYLTSNLTFTRQQQVCPLTIGPELRIDRHFNDGYLVVDFTAQCHGTGPVSLYYSAIFDFDRDHKMLVNMDSDNTFSSAVLSADNPSIELDTARSAGSVFITYLGQGVLHIWMGTDHILFLVVLLLTCVLIRSQNEWRANPNAVAALSTTCWVVTAFTIAHSLTLTATALQWLSFSSRWVEVGIALSILVTAANNIWPWVTRLGWISFAFGLLHGMGFAGVLGELGLAPQQTLVSVLAFNLGVELGQIVILLMLFPLLLTVRNSSCYRGIGINIASAASGLIAIHWALQRL